MLEPIARLFEKERTETEEESADPVQSMDLDDLDEPTGPPTEESAGPDTTELANRLDDLEDEVESTATSLSAIRNAQEETADSVEEVNETVRRLAGIYDQVAAAENPFVEAGDARSDGAGVVGDEAETVSFDDLQNGESDDAATNGEAAHDDDPDASEPAPADWGFEDVATNGETHDDPDHDGRADATTDAAGADPDPAVETDAAGAASTAPAADGSGALVDEVPEGYAGDLLVMEWLARLMDRSGPAGALRATEHYHDLGLISEPVRDRVVTVIGGPSLDVFVDPTHPHEPTVEEHSVSNTYLHALRNLDD
jgi:archaellum component FlaD/FlaE